MSVAGLGCSHSSLTLSPTWVPGDQLGNFIFFLMRLWWVETLVWAVEMLSQISGLGKD